MIQKKICMLGSYAVGKTSLVRRLVHSIFSEKYLTTVGVQIDKKAVSVGDREVTLVLWDIAGEDRFFKVPASYLRGASGYLLVIDGSRRSTIREAVDLHERAQTVMGPVPFRVLLNKADLADDWELQAEGLEKFDAWQWPVLKTSAKTGERVDEAFASLAECMVADRPSEP